MAYTINHYITDWVEESRALMQPDKVLWIDGTETQLEELRREAYITGELIKLNQEKLPGCVYHRSALNDVARVEGRTFICCKKEEDAGPTNNWMAPDEMKAKLHDIYAGCMRGRTMYVIPYSMGAIGSPFAKYGIEITDSIYVVCCMAIMTRVGTKVYEALGDSPDFVKGLHSKAELDADKRYIAHFPEENLIMSVNSGYGGNALLGKKCFALRIASTLGREEGWLAEHMLILGVQNPKGEIRYVCGAFPSACGKTNLAMLIPPAAWREKGWKCWCVGDDIAWLRPGPDGRLWAVNPENGFFGVAPGTSEKTNPNALAATRKNTIFTNVVLKPDGTVWWEGLDKNPPTDALNWKGEPWDPCPARIRTPASPLRRSTVRAFPASLKTRRACPSPRSCSAAAAPRPRRSSTRAATGVTAYSSAASWPPKRPPRPRARSARPAATRWRCSPSAATTWATTGSTGWIWKSSSPSRRSSQTSTGSAPTTRAISSGRASATTCA